jgi:hypothetical protein
MSTTPTSCRGGLLPAYRFDPRAGLWRHAAWPPRPQLTLSDVSFGPDGEMDFPRRRRHAGEEAFPGRPVERRAGADSGGPGRVDAG